MKASGQDVFKVRIIKELTSEINRQFQKNFRRNLKPSIITTQIIFIPFWNCLIFTLVEQIRNILEQRKQQLGFRYKILLLSKCMDL